MSDYYISLVPKKVTLEKPKLRGFEIIHWFIKDGIIAPELSDCTLGKLGYAPGEHYQSILEKSDPMLLELSTNGLELCTERTVFHNGGFELDYVGCPHCKSDLSRSDWSAALEEWLEGKGEGILVCDHCKERSPIYELEYQPNWGFSNLGLTFWNWSSFKGSFIQRLETILNTPIQIVQGKI